MSVAAISSSRRRAGQALAVEGDRLEHPARGREAQLERVDGVEEVLLVLLHVLVVGQREAVHHAVQRRPGARRSRGALARSSSAASGFFFCGMIEEPDAQASETSQKPNSSRRPQHDLRAEAREVRRAGRRGGEEVEDEVAVGDRVDRVRRRRPRSRARDATSRRSVAKFTPASAPAPSGSSRRRAEHELEAPRVAAEHPEVGEQVVREVDRLRALQVRVAGHRPVEVALGDAARARSAGRCSASIARSAWARVNIAMSVATWSLRERAVCSLPPTGPTISVRRRSIAMWMSSSGRRNGNSPPSSSSATRSSPPSSSSRSASVMIPAAASIVAWARDCSTS